MMKNIKEITGIFISSALIMFIVTVNLLGAACYLHIPMESAQSLVFGAKLFICGTVLIWALRMGMVSKKPIMWNIVTAAAAIYLNRLPHYSDAELYSRLHLDIILPLLFIARIIANYAPGQRKKYAFSPCPVYRRGNAAVQSSGYDSDFYDRLGRDIQDEYSAYEAEHIESHNRWLSQCEEEDNARYSAYEEEQSRYEAEETDRYYEEQEKSTRDYYEQQRREEEDRYYYNNY